MSYVSQGVIGLVIGLILVIAVLGILLVIFSIIMLVYGLGQLVPGSKPERCHTWGHDWRRQLPGLPAGTTCRNCIARKDRAVILFRAPPPGMPSVFDPRFGGIVSTGAAHFANKKRPNALILFHETNMPRVAYIPGQPIAWSPPPQQPVQVVFAAGSAPPPQR